MQRCFFLVIFTLCFVLGQAQSPDVEALELSIWYEGEDQSGIHARALLNVKRWDHTSVRFDFHPEQINYIKLREGRLKQDLKFTSKDGLIVVDLSGVSGKSIQFEIDYKIDLEDEYYKGIVNRKETPLSFNLQNLFLHESLGLSGAFFPSIAQDPFVYSANISLPKGINSGTLGILDFEVDHKNGLRTQFWKSSEAILVEDFYLIIGDFKDFDAEDFEDDYEFEEIDLRDFLVREARAEITDVLDFIKERDPSNIVLNMSDDEVLANDSLGKLIKPFLWVKKENTSRIWGSNLFEKEQLLFLKATGGDTLRASLFHLNYISEKEGPKWKARFLEPYWKELSRDKDSASNNRLAIITKTLNWLDAFDPKCTDYFIQNDTLKMGGENWDIFRAIIEANVFPVVNFRYNYRDNQEWIYVDQDNNRLAPLAIPFTLYLFDVDRAREYKSRTSRVYYDTIPYPQSGAPQALLIEYDSLLPAFVTVPRSDLYDLFLFTKAPWPEHRKAALYRLFKTNNANLFSTVLGIAMDSEDGNLRLEAVKNADKLNVPGQLKLKETILQLANNDPLPEVRRYAKSLVQKYYPNK